MIRVSIDSHSHRSTAASRSSQAVRVKNATFTDLASASDIVTFWWWECLRAVGFTDRVWRVSGPMVVDSSGKDVSDVMWWWQSLLRVWPWRSSCPEDSVYCEHRGRWRHVKSTVFILQICFLMGFLQWPLCRNEILKMLKIKWNQSIMKLCLTST